VRLVLASASPRRRELLTAAGFAFDTLPTDVDERQLPGEAPAAYVLRIAAAKSARALELVPARARLAASDNLVVLGADTAVVVDGEILGKPSTNRESARMLERLSGRAHEVLTGVSLRAGQRHLESVETTEVWFSQLSAADIAWYVGTGEGFDKAGGYAVQGLASRFIPRIHGSYANVVGLPVAVVFRLLRQLGHPAAAVASGG
jgi:septum formation protein